MHDELAMAINLIVCLLKATTTTKHIYNFYARII